MLAVEHRERLKPVIEHRAAFLDHRAVDAATTIMPADNHMTHLEVLDREFQHGEDVEIARMDDIRDVPMHEARAGIEAEHVIRGHAAVGTADPEEFRRLLLGHAPEVIRIGAGLPIDPGDVAIEEMIKRG